MGQHNEVTFETELCEHLAQHGWLYSPDDAGYDRQRALYPDDVLAWLEATQPAELAKLIKSTMSETARAKARDALLDRLAKLLDKGHPTGGTLRVLRSPFKDTPATFTMMQTRPQTAFNPTVTARYAANRLRVMRQVHYSTKNNKSIDLVLFVNGIPVATVELKTDFTQNVADAKHQYMTDRPPAGEPLLGFGTRALVHFAVSNDEVWMTTKLAGPDTRFLPFNRGNDGRAGNPPDPTGQTSPTAYLWEDVWNRDRWLDILGRFIHYETVTTVNPTTRQKSTSTNLIFPRYHQLDAVTKLVADSREHGAGKRYLIQHSAGSGKTRTIAWTAHRLATLFDDTDTKVFDTVIVVTDRTVLDDQLQEAVKQIEPTPGIVQNINQKEAARYFAGMADEKTSKSNLLGHTLTSGKLILVVTIQTFPFVLKAIAENDALKQRRFAVIADEAHSSQAGETAKSLRKALGGQSVADADVEETDLEDLLVEEMSYVANTPNISFYAFTATPKPKTLELFGTPDEDDLDGEGRPRPHPFHLYTMQQAIEEHFILDVLQNYTIYDTAYQLAKKVENGQMQPLVKGDGSGDLVDETAATKELLRWVALHPTNIAQKVQIIVEHFEANVKHLLGGQAKAMVVTDSRIAAVKYKKAIDAYITKHGYTDATALVAFSGEVEVKADDLQDTGDLITVGEKFTEARMNPKGTSDLRAAFDTTEYRVMIVANKFQTGFDQPKLCAMYVDKQLSGVAAVQTLSRLNRYVPGKKTMVIDFRNSAEEIERAFAPYFREARIEATTDPNLIHDLQTKLDLAGFYTPDEVDTFAVAYLTGKGNNALAGALAPVKQRFIAAYTTALTSNDKARLDELGTFRKDVSTFVKIYDFLSQVVDFGDTEVEKRAIFFRHLASQITPDQRTPAVDLSAVELEGVKHTAQPTLAIGLVDDGVLPPAVTAAGSHKVRDPRLVLLDEIIAKLNERFAGEGFRREQTESWLEALVAAMRMDEELREQAEANNEQQFLASPTLRDAVLLAVDETHGAHSRMTTLVHEKGAVEQTVIQLIGRLLYLELHGVTTL